VGNSPTVPSLKGANKNGYVFALREFLTLSGYGAFTKSHAEKDQVIEYIKQQEEHHKTVSFIDEFKDLLRKEGIDFDKKYLE